MRVESVSNLIDSLSEFRLLEPAQFDELRSALQTRFADPRSLARELLQRGWLTAYQVNQLFQGRGADLVLGSYVVLERLGEGGMGQVFKARHQKLGRTVAIKIIRQDRLGNAEAMRRFRREILVAAQLSHPNVVHSYDADQIGDRHLIVMEYVDGTDLSRLVRQSGPLPVRDACDCVRQAALGLQHAHEHSLVHRDLKPSNLLLTKAQGSAAGLGQVKLLDLGLARSLMGDDSSMVTQDGALIGTPDFIAPEQARSAHSADIRSDLYSLGCTLFFLLTGRAPFLGGSMTEKLLKHHWDTPPPVESLRPDVPPVVSAIIRKLLAKRPEDRLHTPQQLADVLAKALEAGGMDGPIPSELAMRPSDPDTMLPAAIPIGPPTADMILPQALMATPTHGEATEVSLPVLPMATVAARPRRWPFVVGAIGCGGVVLLLLAGAVASMFFTHPRETVSTRVSVATHPAVEAALSPLDKLSRDQIPALERIGGQPKELVAVLGEHRGRHFGPVRCVAFSPDGLTLASTGEDGYIRLWNPMTLQPKQTLKGGAALGAGVVFAPNGHFLAACDWDGTVRIWDLMRQPLRDPSVVENRAPVVALAVSPDSRTLAAALDDKTVQLWRLAQQGPPRKGPLLQGHQDDLSCVAISPDGTTLASGSEDHTIRVYDLSGAEPQLRAVLTDHQDTVNALAFTPDSHTLASGGRDQTVRFWDLSRQKPVARGSALEVGGRITSLVYVDNQTFVCGRSDGIVEVFDSRGPRPKSVAQVADTCRVRTVAWSPKTELLASGSVGGLVRVWDWNDGQPRERVTPHGHTGRVHALAFTPDGQTLASGSQDGSVRLWSVEGSAMQERATLQGQGADMTSVAFSSDGKRLAAASQLDSHIRLWVLPATVPRTWPMTRGEDCVGGAVAFLDDRILAAAGRERENEGVIRLWDVSGTEPQPIGKPFRGHRETIQSLAVSPDRKTLATAGGTEPMVRLWDRESQRELHRFFGVKGGSVGSVAFSPDGHLLVFSSANPANARAGNPSVVIRRVDMSAAPPKDLDALPGHDADVHGVAFAPDGHWLATGDEDGRLILWEPNSARNLQDWRFPGAITALQFAPDGRHLAVGNGNGTIYILRLKAAPHPVGIGKS